MKVAAKVESSRLEISKINERECFGGCAKPSPSCGGAEVSAKVESSRLGISRINSMEGFGRRAKPGSSCGGAEVFS